MILFLQVVDSPDISILLEVDVKVGYFIVLVGLLQLEHLLSRIEIEQQLYLLIGAKSKTLLQHLKLHALLELDSPLSFLLLLLF